MKELLFLRFITLLWWCGIYPIFGYVIPNLTFEILPDGFKISIPDIMGIERVAFNVNRNRAFRSFEQGDFSEQIRAPTDGKYTIKVKRPLNDDDIIYVWSSVQYKKQIFRKIHDPIAVRDGSSSSVSRPNLSPTPNSSNEEIDNQKSDLDPSESCEKPLTRVKKKNERYIPRCRGEQIFNEDFDGNKLKTDIWNAEVRLSNEMCEDEFVLYNTSNIEVNNDLLSIKATLWDVDVRRGSIDLRDKCTERSAEYCTREPHGPVILPPVISGRINTKSTFSIQYGRFVVRAKFPQGNWLYPLLLLEPASVFLNDPLPCLHTRIAFVRGNEHLLNIPGTEDIGAHYLSGGVILTEIEANRNQFTVNRTSTKSFSGDFHIYELIWNEEFLIFKIDEEEYGRIRIADLNANSNQNLLDREFALTLGLSAGGHSDFPDRGFEKPWANTAPKAALNFWQTRNTWKGSWIDPAIKIDYIRVYAV